MIARPVETELCRAALHLYVASFIAQCWNFENVAGCKCLDVTAVVRGWNVTVLSNILSTRRPFQHKKWGWW